MRLLQNLQISKAEPHSAEKQEISAVHIISILRSNSTRCSSLYILLYNTVNLKVTVAKHQNSTMLGNK